MTRSVNAKSAVLRQKVAGLEALSNPEERKRIADDLRQLVLTKQRLNAAKALADWGAASDSVPTEWLEVRRQLW